MALTEVARLALQDHVPLLQSGEYAKRYDWNVDMDWEAGLCHVRLYCPFTSVGVQTRHIYTLKLSFEYYNIEQPGVIFVNPETLQIGSSEDFQRWWPNIDGNPWINIQIDQGNPANSYLCFQWTYEFKKTHIAPERGDPKRWDPQRHNVVGVVYMVQRALLSEHYMGYRKQ